MYLLNIKKGTGVAEKRFQKDYENHLQLQVT